MTDTKVWRQRCKQRIVDAMGGKCSTCGYATCLASLALHHLNPAEKDLAISSLMVNKRSWQLIVVELRKCILVCHNCHNEIHHGFRVVPQDVVRFNESYVSYDGLLMNKLNELGPCGVCNKPKPIHLKYCSRKCVARSQDKVDWESSIVREQLATKPVKQLAEELKCSDVTVYKKLREFGIIRLTGVSK